MLDATPIEFQRSHGAARVALSAASGRTRLADLYQSGSAKAILPRVAGAVPEVVFLNTSGGLTSGDRLEYRLDLGPGAEALATTQTAERAYMAAQGAAEVGVSITAGRDARVDWLPQETILFNAAQVRRSTRIDLAMGASCLYAETVVLGRAAMGETVRTLAFRDERLITRDGTPILSEPLMLDDRSMASAPRPALIGTARAFATVALVRPGAEDAAGALGELLAEPGVEAAASGFDGKCLVRLMAPDGWPLRRVMARLLTRLSGRTLPRVWQM
jgi:urease accessory protein